jgi:hypothetical protein
MTLKVYEDRELTEAPRPVKLMNAGMVAEWR